jgi:ATP-dependent helicase/nuclease subunit B
MIPYVTRLGGESVVQAITRGATVCVATQRLAHALHDAWTGLMREQGRIAWRTPDILTLGTWRRRTAMAFDLHRHGSGDEPAHILEQQQELLTWEQAAAAAGVLGDVLQPRQLASAMMEAHAFASAWDIRIDPTDVLRGSDADVFLAVRAQAEERWRQLGATSSAMLPWRAIEAIRARSRELPPEMLFIGFDLPADAVLRETLDALRVSGVPVTLHTVPHPPSRARLLRYPAFEDELHAAAQWCRELLGRGEGEIGIIIPHLETVRPLVTRVFDAVLHPSSVLGGGRAEGLFELSLGPRAIEEPLIAAAFNLLEIQRPVLPVERWTQLLHSPFTRGADAWGDRRARIDFELRRRGLSEAGAADVLRAAGSAEPSGGDPVMAALGELRSDGARRTAAEWTLVFLQLLESFGWPGDRDLGSREYQARGRFRELLQEFVSLDVVMAPIPLGEALARFRALAAERVFQVKSVNAPVQIMGVRECAGLRFAHSRVLGMNDDIWPPAPRIASFIPIHLQRRAGVQAAIPERHLAQVRDETALLLRTAPEVTFTCSVADGDRALLPTAMLQDLIPEDRGAQRYDAVHALSGTARGALSPIADTQGPAVDGEEHIRGGTAVIALQAACPFRAFAELRLHAAQPAAVEHGVRALDRGNLVHAALERFWKQVTDHATLISLDDGALHGIIDAIVRETLREEAALRGRRIADHLIEAEGECLRRLLLEWLAIEGARQPFRVEGTELRSGIDLRGLHLDVRADRIDRLSDGSALLIDYKTGSKSVGDWMSARPAEPQIPLYLQALGADFRAAAFAVLRRGECRFAGLRDDGAPMEECTSASDYLEKREMPERDWSALRARWSSVLLALASDFMSGNAVVDPRDGADTCAYCDLSAFCRIDEEMPEEGGGEDA